MTVPLRRPLSRREHQIVQLLSRGRTNAEIATELGITVNTVKGSIQHGIANKTGSSCRAGIVGAAFRAGVLL